jgi:pilus assembly protein CpaE
MNRAIRALVAIDPAVDHGLVKAALPMDEDVDVVAMVDGYGGVREASLRNGNDVLIVACAAGSEDGAVALVDESRRQHPDRPVIVLSQGVPNGLVKRIFSAGADDIATLPVAPEQLRFMIDKAFTRRDVPAGGDGTALAEKHMIVVLGPKGGTGKTLSACNLAVKLAEDGVRTVLIDLDLQFGDVGLALGMKPERTIYDLATAPGSIDADKVEGYLTEHTSGLMVLMAPARPDQAAAIGVEFLAEMYRALRERFQHIIVDTPPGFTPEVIASVDVSTDIIMVGMLDTLSLKNTRLGLETLELMAYPREDVTFVLNRSDSRVGINHSDVASIVGRAPDTLIPSDRDIPLSVNESTPVVQSKPKSEAAKAFTSLAARFQSQAAPTTTTTTNGAVEGRRLLRKRG